MTEWQPIETAPKPDIAGKETTGTSILVYADGVVGIAAWEIINQDRRIGWWQYRAGANEAAFGDYDPSPTCEPTHWMPLPEPPK